MNRYNFGAQGTSCYDGNFLERAMAVRVWGRIRAAVFNRFCVGLLGLLVCSLAQAFPQGEITLGRYQLLYSVLNSTTLPAQMAETYGFKRKADEVLVNITVLDTQTKKAVPVALQGNAKNLIQQSKSLVFRELKEADAVYYLATLRTTEREIFHFLLNVTLPDGSVQTAKFTQELFVNP